MALRDWHGHLVGQTFRRPKAKDQDHLQDGSGKLTAPASTANSRQRLLAGKCWENSTRRHHTTSLLAGKSLEALLLAGAEMKADSLVSSTDSQLAGRGAIGKANFPGKAHRT